jgi:hypothetical protein
MPAPLERRIDELYGLELERFTPARNALAAELKRAGEQARADEVRGLVKPTRAAWALNRAARARPKEIRAVLRAGDDVRRAQERRVAGGRDDVLDRAGGQLRAALDDLLAAVRSVLEAAGLPATDDTLERVAQTVQAAIVDPGLRGTLEAGRLAADARPSGLDALVALAAAAGGRRSQQRQRRTESSERPTSRRAEARSELVAETRERRRELAAQARQQRGKADAAAREAARAEAEATRLRGVAREEERLAAESEKQASKAAEALRRLVDR